MQRTGRIVSENNEIKNICKHYYTLNKKGKVTLSTNSKTVELPIIDEVPNAIAALKNGKAPRIDSIPSKMFKIGSDNLIKSIRRKNAYIMNEISR